MWRNSNTQYGSVSKFFHWVIFLLLVGMLIPAVTFHEACADKAEMTPGGKFAASVVIGGTVGIIGAQVLKSTVEAQMCTFLSAIVALYAFYLLRESREDAVTKTLGSEYVGVSGLAALAVGMMVYKK